MQREETLERGSTLLCTIKELRHSGPGTPQYEVRIESEPQHKQNILEVIKLYEKISEKTLIDEFNETVWGIKQTPTMGYASPKQKTGPTNPWPWVDDIPHLTSKKTTVR